jgi:hypothetical protein
MYRTSIALKRKKNKISKKKEYLEANSLILLSAISKKSLNIVA